MLMPQHPLRAAYLRLGAAAALLIGLLAACGPAPPEPSLPPGGPTPTVTVPFEMPVVVSVAGRFADAELALLEEQIAAFEAANPDILVEIVAAPPRTVARRAAFARFLESGDASRDIYLLENRWLAEFAAHGWLTPLDEYVEGTPILAEMFPAGVQAGRINGKLMALPWTVDGGVLYYRRDLVDEPPSDWDAVQRAALEGLASSDPTMGYVWQGDAYDSLTYNTLEFIWSYGGAVFGDGGRVAFDGPETRSALAAMLAMISSGASPPEVTTFREGTSLLAFRDGDAVLMRNWVYAWDRLQGADSTVAGKVGLAPLPASCLGGRSLVLSPYSRHPEQAFRVMTFLVGEELQRQLALHGILPPALETVYDDADLLAAKPVLADLHAALSVAKPPPQIAEYDRLSEIVYDQVHRMLVGEQGVEETAANIQRQLETLTIRGR